MILASERPTRQEEALASFRGSRAHDYNWLKAELRKRNVVLSRDIADCLSRVNLWSTELRYDPVVISSRTAHRFLVDAEQLIEWASRSM